MPRPKRIFTDSSRLGSPSGSNDAADRPPHAPEPAAAAAASSSSDDEDEEEEYSPPDEDSKYASDSSVTVPAVVVSSSRISTSVSLLPLVLRLRFLPTLGPELNEKASRL